MKSLYLWYSQCRNIELNHKIAALKLELEHLKVEEIKWNAIIEQIKREQNDPLIRHF